MTQLRWYGNPVAIGSEAYGNTGVAPIPATAIAPITIRRHARNGLAPQVEFANRLREAADYGAIYRSKQVLGLLGIDGFNCPKLTGGTAAMRFATHTGPYAHAFRIMAVLYPVPSGPVSQSTYTVKVYSDAAMSTLVGSADLAYGPTPSGTQFGWRMTRVLSGWIDGIPGDTDLYITISGDNGKLGGLAIFEMQSLTENNAGYLANNLTMHSPVLGTDRSQVHALLKNQWKRGGSTLIQWSAVTGWTASQFNTDTNGNQFPSTTSTSLVNWADRSSTSNTSSTPGYYLDLRYKDRVSQSSGVPCKMWAYAYTDSGDAQISLVNSAGTTLASVTGFSTSASWKSTTFNAPATLDKIDIMMRSTSSPGARVHLGAVSVIEYE